MRKAKMVDDNFVEMVPTRFGYCNEEARVVLVGITPGNTQLNGEREGLSDKEIKRKYAFGGRMRPNLWKMLDAVGVNGLLDIASCETLWKEDFDKVEMTSLLKDATYYKGKMFNRARDIGRSAKMSRALEDGFKSDCRKYSNAVLYIGMGEQVGEVLAQLKSEGAIAAEVAWIPHPSGANAERVAAFLGQKHDSFKPACKKAQAQRISVSQCIAALRIYA